MRTSTMPATCLQGVDGEAVVRRAELVADGVLSLELAAPDGGPLPRWEPGAHISVVLGSGLVREYSLCGDPGDRDVYRIAVLDEPGGRGGSRELHRTAVPGARLGFRGPRNHFPLRSAADYLFIAGGIGITPILPMLRAVAGGDARWELVYGGRSRRTMAFTEEVRALGGPRLTLVPQDELGLPDLGSRLAAAAPSTAVYCCGPPPLLDAVERHCDRLGLLGSLRVERFRPGTPEPPREDADRPIEVELRRSGKRVTVLPGRSVLSAVREVLPRVASSCEEGYCGTCEAGVLDGVPDHRDTVLSEEDRARGDCMMICVSRARTSNLALDL
ncbi:PDR/VanB family oxidoreductase [Amycolatopsis sp. CA-230715]|uniref:PDR/VanB family oxidoreductase n=1 Tax=Amycolatopsis sp. CA-230715 TaxID=2745196 RepID=UPI001C323227|nr:PDR/VanB family oxidoreductase [Amycolatopsis sp. CA-230715]QWF84411.1 Phenoxybenzoate dioxygenase subunit beta [Amycolatopsis sp. CA-230715]